MASRSTSAISFRESCELYYQVWMELCWARIRPCCPRCRRPGPCPSSARREILYVYLLEDGTKAEFETPASPLAGEHEVVVATSDGMPRLDGRRGPLPCMAQQQPVRVPETSSGSGLASGG